MTARTPSAPQLLRRWGGPAVIGLVAALSTLAVPAYATSGPRATLLDCTEAGLQAVIAPNGSSTVEYGRSCNDVVFAVPIVVGVGATVDIEANGNIVTFDGQTLTRLFQVSGGSLTLGGLTLTQGRAQAVDGADGAGRARRSQRQVDPRGRAGPRTACRAHRESWAGPARPDGRARRPTVAPS